MSNLRVLPGGGGYVIKYFQLDNDNTRVKSKKYPIDMTCAYDVHALSRHVGRRRRGFVFAFISRIVYTGKRVGRCVERVTLMPLISRC